MGWAVQHRAVCPASGYGIKLDRRNRWNRQYGGRTFILCMRRVATLRRVTALDKTGLDLGVIHQDIDPEKFGGERHCLDRRPGVLHSLRIKVQFVDNHFNYPSDVCPACPHLLYYRFIERRGPMCNRWRRRLSQAKQRGLSWFVAFSSRPTYPCLRTRAGKSSVTILQTPSQTCYSA